MSRRATLSIVALLGGLALLVVVGWQVALGQLKGAVERGLGPRASVGAVDAGWAGIELRDVRIRAARGWPAEDELRAARIVVVPDLASLWSAGWRVRRITVDDAFVSVLRTRDGRLRVVPALMEPRVAVPRVATPAVAATPVRIGEVRLVGATVAFFDASVRQPAHRMRLERLRADVGPLLLPALDQPVSVDLQGVFKGPQRDGRVAIRGTVTPATRDARIDARFAGVDLVALQPYLMRVTDGGVRRGTLDLKLDATVREQRLRAPGTLTLTGVELAGGSLAGVPRQAVLAALGRDGRIEVQFTLDGRLDDPRFSLNEVFAVKVAAALAESLGVSLGGVVEGVGGVVKGLFGR